MALFVDGHGAAWLGFRTVGVIDADEGIMSAMAYADYVEYFTCKAPSYQSCTDAFQDTVQC